MQKYFYPFQVLNCKIQKLALLLVLALMLIPGLPGCDVLTNPDDDDENDKLYVKFINESASQYTITTIQLQPMGVAGEESTPSGTWSADILTDGKAIAPGGHEFFNLPIENRHWSQYRLGVDGGNGNELMLHMQEGYNPLWTLPITHWGSHERTVTVTVLYDEYTNQIYVSGYSDFAGIEE